jgi:hypothetical protein
VPTRTQPDLNGFADLREIRGECFEDEGRSGVIEDAPRFQAFGAEDSAASVTGDD